MSASVIGAQLFTLRDFLKTPQEIRTTFARVRKMGYEAVQCSALGPIEAPELKQIATDSGLQIVATHISYDRIRDEPQAVIDDHNLWGCRHVAIGGMPPAYRDSAGFERFAREASAAVRPLIDAGLTFSYHNHQYDRADDANVWGGELSWHTPVTGLSFSFRRVDGSTARLRYSEVRGYAYRRIGSYNIVLDALNDRYDEEVRGVADAYALSLSLGYDHSDRLRLAADVEYGSNPFY